MAKLISMKNNGEKYLYEIEAETQELNQIKGSSDNLIFFSDENFNLETNISKRGRQGRTKYFLIPKGLRKRIDLSDKRIVCQRLDLKNKIFFVYAVSKEGFCN